ncbi:MAG: chondroitin lyase [Phycisphaerae bacterium]|nr:chondroitin lyase [Phycisphaerae bacterium]
MKIILSMIFCFAMSTLVFAQNDLQVIKTNLIKELLRSDINDSLVEQAMSTIKDDGSWPEINYKDLSLTGYQHSIHVENLESMALAYCNNKSKFYKDQKLKITINKALKFWCEYNFISANWWYNIVFTPRTFVKISLIMEKDIDPDILKKLQPMIKRASKDDRWARQSADRVKICSIEAQNYILIGDEENFSQLIDIIQDQIKLMTGFRGMQCDFSFHHRVHRVNNTVSYGSGYGQNCALWAACVAGTKYAFSEEKIKLLVDYHLDGLCKQKVYGKYDDKGVANRDITRKETASAHSLLIPLENLYEASDYRKNEIKEIIDLCKGKIDKPTLSFAKFFWQSEHFVFQRPDFYTSVRMFSTRNRNMELAHNSEGIFNHYKSDGANHLAVKGDEYLNIWPVYDWQKIPGTTVLQKPKMPSSNEVLQDGLTDFVGAATDGLYGVVGFDFISPHDFIRVKKSWFFFDDEYVCLGAGIASNDFNNPIATTINQSLLRSDVIVSRANEQTKIEPGDHHIDQTKWVFHNGIGYIFPEPANINLSNKTESGRWYDINKQSSSSKELVEKDVFKLWINHGKRPQGENLWLYPGKMDTKDVTYQYIVVPVTIPKQLNTERPIETLSNNSQIQCVKHTSLGIVQAVFYTSGTITIAKAIDITLDSPGIVMLKMKNNKIDQITVSDPTRKLSRLHMSISGEKDIAIDLPQGDYAGTSVTIENQ